MPVDFAVRFGILSELGRRRRRPFTVVDARIWSSVEDGLAGRMRMWAAASMVRVLQRRKTREVRRSVRET